MTIEFYRDEDGQWRWRAIAGNHEKIANGGEGYHNLADARAGLALLAGAIEAGDYELKVEDD